MSEWLNHYPGSANFVASHWLKQWGLDIARMAEDRDSRNVASYRPTAFVSSGGDSVQKTVTSVCQLWELCEPRLDGGFQVMDRHILRTSLQEASRPRAEGSNGLGGALESDVQRILNSISPGDLNETQWKAFLLDLKQHPIIAEASGNLR